MGLPEAPTAYAR